jgi:hypothetical protein
VNRLQKQISSKRDAAWIQALQGGGSVAIAGSVLEEISGRFCQLPKLDWFKGEIERAVKPLFDRFPANAMPLAALGAITAAVWNRNMVWLGEVPPAQSEPAQLPPQLRVPRPPEHPRKLPQHRLRLLHIRLNQNLLHRQLSIEQHTALKIFQYHPFQFVQ